MVRTAVPTPVRPWLPRSLPRSSPPPAKRFKDERSIVTNWFAFGENEDLTYPSKNSKNIGSASEGDNAVYGDEDINLKYEIDLPDEIDNETYPYQRRVTENGCLVEKPARHLQMHRLILAQCVTKSVLDMLQYSLNYADIEPRFIFFLVPEPGGSDLKSFHLHLEKVASSHAAEAYLVSSGINEFTFQAILTDEEHAKLSGMEEVAETIEFIEKYEFCE